MEKAVKYKAKSGKLGKVSRYIILSIFALFGFFPLVWLFDFSLCKNSDLFGSYILKIPSPPQFINYAVAWTEGKVSTYLLNSIIVNLVTVVITVVLSIMMGYAFTRMQWKLRGKLLSFVLLGMMIPIHATLLPNFKTFQALGLTNSYFGLIIPYVAFAMPLGVFIMTGFLESIPKSLEESAVMDGCGIFRIIFQIIMPITKPAIVSIALMTFINSWNEFIMAATYLSSDKYRTLPFAVYNFAGQYSSDYAKQFAVMALTSLPAIIVYILLNEQITKGATMGAVKG